jgi:Arc/MetJ-type ribon-helix-helix transcriptional regulator
MTTISLKLPEHLARLLDAEARSRGVGKSAVIRDCITGTLAKPKTQRAVTCADLARDLIGSQPGPRDASTNKAYLKGFGRERKRAR